MPTDTRQLADFTERDKEKFQLKYTKDGPQPQGSPAYQGLGKCWQWTAGAFNHGYGSYDTSIGTISAHRFAFILKNGSLKKADLILHRCDNPKCVNPDHLFTGTPMDNSRDRVQKQKGNSNGDERGKRKLTKEAVIEIRRLRDDGLSLNILAARYGVTKITISSAALRKTWAWVE